MPITVRPSLAPLVLYARRLPDRIELGRQRRAWEAVRPDAYAFRYRRENFRHPGGEPAARVVVRGGRGYGQPFTASAMTIDDLFALAASARARGVHVGLWYDPVYHYPVRMFIDNPRIFDDEHAIHIDSFAVLRAR